MSGQGLHEKKEPPTQNNTLLPGNRTTANWEGERRVIPILEEEKKKSEGGKKKVGQGGEGRQVFCSMHRSKSYFPSTRKEGGKNDPMGEKNLGG